MSNHYFLTSVPRQFRMQSILLIAGLVVFNSMTAQFMYDGSGGGFFEGNKIGKVVGTSIYDGKGNKIGKFTGNHVSSTWGSCVVYDANGKKLGMIRGNDIYNAVGSKAGVMPYLDNGNDPSYFLNGAGKKIGTLGRLIYDSDGKETRSIYDNSNRLIGESVGLTRQEVILFFYFFMR